MRQEAISSPAIGKNELEPWLAEQVVYESIDPVYGRILRCLERDFERLVNAVGSRIIPLTNNAAELLIRQFASHYKTMCGLGNLGTARRQANIFAIVYRFTPLTQDARPELRGLCPLKMAGYEVLAGRGFTSCCGRLSQPRLPI